jgi:hypothetical protein
MSLSLDGVDFQGLSSLLEPSSAESVKLDLTWKFLIF